MLTQNHKQTCAPNNKRIQYPFHHSSPVLSNLPFVRKPTITGLEWWNEIVECVSIKAVQVCNHNPKGSDMRSRVRIIEMMSIDIDPFPEPFFLVA